MAKIKKETLLKAIGVFIAISALADTHFELLQSVGLDLTTINWIKLIGLVMALLLPSISTITNKDGLGGSNPPPIKDEK